MFINRRKLGISIAVRIILAPIMMSTIGEARAAGQGSDAPSTAGYSGKGYLNPQPLPPGRALSGRIFSFRLRDRHGR